MDILAIWNEFNELNDTNIDIPEELLKLSTMEEYEKSVFYDLLRGETLDSAMQSN